MSMITLLPNTITPSINWLFSQKRDTLAEQNANTGDRQRTVVPTAIFSVGDLHFWEGTVEW